MPPNARTSTRPSSTWRRRGAGSCSAPAVPARRRCCARSPCRPPRPGERDQVVLLGLDFASRGLGALASLAQVVDVATGDDLEAVTRHLAVLFDELHPSAPPARRCPRRTPHRVQRASRPVATDRPARRRVRRLHVDVRRHVARRGRHGECRAARELDRAARHDRRRRPSGGDPHRDHRRPSQRRTGPHPRRRRQPADHAPRRRERVQRARHLLDPGQATRPLAGSRAVGRRCHGADRGGLPRSVGAWPGRRDRRFRVAARLGRSVHPRQPRPRRRRVDRSAARSDDRAAARAARCRRHHGIAGGRRPHVVEPHRRRTTPVRPFDRPRHRGRSARRHPRGVGRRPVVEPDRSSPGPRRRDRQTRRTCARPRTARQPARARHGRPAAAPAHRRPRSARRPARSTRCGTSSPTTTTSA